MRSSDSAPRRVLYLVTSDISARFLRGQLAHLIDRGFTVSVGTKLSDPPAEFDEGVTVHDVPFAREPSPLADARALVTVARLVRELRPAVVNASTPKAGLIGMLAAWLLRVPRRIYVVRGLRFETTSGIARQALRSVERLTTACATDVVYNSPSLREVAERERTVRPGRGVVLAGGSGNGIDVDRYATLPGRTDARAQLGVPADAHVLGFVGRLTRDKGVVDLVDALSPVDDVVVLLAGDFESGDPVPDETRSHIATDPRFVHVPWLDDTRLVYAAMDLLVFPSYREGLPNVPLEAQLCGVPVIAYDSTGTVDAVFQGPPNELVPTGDGAALRAAVERHLAAEPSGGDEPRDSAAGRWVAERFESTRIWNELLTLYRPGRTRSA